MYSFDCLKSSLEVQGKGNSEQQNRRISNVECRRVESLCSNLLKRKDRKVDSILISNYCVFFSSETL